MTGEALDVSAELATLLGMAGASIVVLLLMKLNDFRSKKKKQTKQSETVSLRSWTAIEAAALDAHGPKNNPYIWCFECCQNVLVFQPHTCHDYINEIVTAAIPDYRKWKKRKLLYQQIYRIAIRKDIYRDF